MKNLCQGVFWLGIVSIPLSWLMWYFGAELEMGRQVMGNITDPAMQTALKEAHAERWGIFVGLWPVTLLVLGSILEKKCPGSKG